MWDEFGQRGISFQLVNKFRLLATATRSCHVMTGKMPISRTIENAHNQMPKPNLKQLRQHVRDARKAIPADYARQASYKFSERFAELPAYQSARHVAGFLPFDGEADPLPLMDRAILEGKQVYVPIIIAKAEPLLFAPWTRQTKIKKNSFGIDEPDVSRVQMIEARELDFVITPLVAFDESCNRLGVGGGYYDRSFAFLKGVDNRSVRMVGIAYELQCVAKLPSSEWDVQLDGVVTELKVRSGPE